MMEWVFAMSTFRDEFGVWFLVMFISLFAGKIWGWIAEGRVEHLEQQAMNDTRLLHPRLLTSLGIYVAFAAWMFNYCLDVVVLEARPGMTIMFVFEFAILCVSAVTACARYALWVQEHRITRQQMTQAVEARKKEIREQRREAEEKIKANPEAEDNPRMEDLPKEEDVDENEIETPGWEAKRGWLFALDIVSGMLHHYTYYMLLTNVILDLLKLVAYMAFFTILTVFYGIPIYIIRDLYMTMRSFTKRVTDYLRFQAATRDMDTRYPNATAQDLAADNTCIVCREEMRPVPEGGAAGGAVGQAMAQRQKPKKLPCGHILHFGCLSSWLERQQACPICRRSVFTAGTGPAGAAGQAGAVPGAPGAAGAHAPNQNLPRGQHAQDQGRVFRLGPLRIQLGGQLPGRHNDQELLNALGRLAQNHRQAQQQRLANGGAPNTGAAAEAGTTSGAAPNTTDFTAPSVTDPVNSDIHPGIRSAAARMALNTIEMQIQREMQALSLQVARSRTIRRLLNELDSLRGIPQPPPSAQSSSNPLMQALAAQNPLTPAMAGQNIPLYGSLPQGFAGSATTPLQWNQQTVPFARAADGNTSVQPPPGMVVPEGWTLTPLNPIPEPSTSQQQALPQTLQDLLQPRMNGEGASSASRTPSQLNGTNPLAQFFATSLANGHIHPHPHPHPPYPHSHASPSMQGPFPPPPPPPPPNTASSATTTNGTPRGSTSQEITPTNSNPSSLPGRVSPPSSTGPRSLGMGTGTDGAVDAGVPPPPTAVTGSWSFPPASANTAAQVETPTSVPAPASASTEESAKGKGKASATVPETVVEPPTPTVGGSSNVNGKQPSVEDVEGEDPDV